MQYIVLDLEWNQALTKERVRRHGVVLSGEIIQIGAVRLADDLTAADSVRLRVTPQYYKKMHWSVRKLTGISTKSLEGGLSFPDAYEQLSTWWGEDAVILTWGPDDIPMLKSNLRLHGIDTASVPQSYDLQLIYSRTVSGEKKQCSLADALEKLGITDTEPPHDALNDAINTARICPHLPLADAIAHYNDDVPLKTPAEDKPAGEEIRYESYEEMMQANDKPTLACPACGAPITFGKWVRRSAGRRSTMALCSCAQPAALKLRWIDEGEPGGPIIAYRSLDKASTDQLEAYYRALKRRRRRKK